MVLCPFCSKAQHLPSLPSGTSLSPTIGSSRPSARQYCGRSVITGLLSQASAKKFASTSLFGQCWRCRSESRTKTGKATGRRRPGAVCFLRLFGCEVCCGQSRATKFTRSEERICSLRRGAECSCRWCRRRASARTAKCSRERPSWSYARRPSDLIALLSGGQFQT